MDSADFKHISKHKVYYHFIDLLFHASMLFFGQQEVTIFGEKGGAHNNEDQRGESFFDEILCLCWTQGTGLESVNCVINVEIRKRFIIIINIAHL